MLSDQQFHQLCVANPELRIETSPTVKLIVMPAVFLEASERNSELIGQLWQWNQISELGKVFDSSGEYWLANGFRPAPDGSWAQNERLADISLKQFVPIPRGVVQYWGFLRGQEFLQ